MNGFTLLAGLACILAILEQERAADLLHDGVPIAGPGWLAYARSAPAAQA